MMALPRQSFGIENKLEDIKKEYESLLDKKYILLPHKGTYILPISYNNNPNQKTFSEIEKREGYDDRGKLNRHLEAEFQISFLFLTNKNLFGTKFNTFVGYTHQAHWQVYNDKWSRPFRETNYMPELFGRRILDKPMNIFGVKFIGYDAGFVHQSNGQVQELSRSWNRLFIRGVFLSGKTLINISAWHRLSETDGLDENPNMHRYIGYGEIDLTYKYGNQNFQLRIIPGTEHLSGELGFSTPWKEGLRFYTKISHGHGLSLQDYDHKSRKFGLGIILSDPFSITPN